MVKNANGSKSLHIDNLSQTSKGDFVKEGFQLVVPQ